MSRILLALVAAALLVVGCSDGDEKPPKQDLGPDIKIYDDMQTGDGGQSCGPGIYPCGPYGTKTGTVARNMEFIGFSDPKNHCTAHKDKVMDLTTKRKIAFKDWHLGDSSCPQQKKKLLWIMVSAGWCTPCKNEVKATQADYAKGAVDPRLGILNIVFEDDNYMPISESFLKTWINGYQLTFPVVMDPSFKMGAYFNKKASPFNMLVETETGKIYYQQVGGDIKDVGDKAIAYFK